MIINSKNTCMNCIKKEHSLLKDLSQDELVLFERNRIVANYKKGETIFKEGTKSMGLLCLNEGKVKIVKEANNKREQIIGFKKPVDFIGFRALLGKEKYSASGVAIDNSSVCIIDKDDFFEVVNNNNDFAMKIIRLLARELGEANIRTINLTQKHLRARLADALLLIEDVYGVEKDNKTINVSLKREELANISNMITSNVIRALSEFVKEHLIETDKRKIKILNRKALEDISAMG